MRAKIPNISEFLDDHEEQHAVPTGAALGFSAVATGRLAELGMALAILSEALERGRDRPPAADTQDLANDVRREPHYFFFGLILGGAVGVAARLVQ
ncbi:hypothetical protein [Haloarcula pellucida]|uniref:Uncharacterized protein n=1 Tax=Haloarcula pellucida TaxID=1427151 RepID=A0A830GT10_9EURY|nr:hypothetical protein [Halomicroarcula pellucida]MBX0350547.1 hypothetical protein [Halomicroarcula pellucida]GGO03838.1 hypothetical protein GCM10009030_39940 [Halomicroarcula pellucida]